MTEREALKLALEALEANFGNWNAKAKAIPIIKEVLAQPEQEPMAFICQGNAYMADDVDEYCTAKHTPLYTTPPQRTWVGLTKQDVYDLYNKMLAHEGNNIATRYQDFAKYLEAKLKEKNT